MICCTAADPSLSWPVSATGQAVLHHCRNAELASLAEPSATPASRRARLASRYDRHPGEAGHYDRDHPAVPYLEASRQGTLKCLACPGDVAELEAGVAKQLKRARAYRPEADGPA